MSVELTHELPGWNSICETLAETRSEHASTGRLIGELFDGFDALLHQLAADRRRWVAEATGAAGNAPPGDAPSAPVASEPDPQTLDLLREIREQQESLRGVFDGQTPHEQPLDEFGKMLQAATADVAEIRSQLDELRVASQSTGDVPAPQHDDTGEMSELRQKLSDLEQERTELELELEHVRQRAAEMASTAEEQKRSWESQQQQFSGELKALRRMMQALAERPYEEADGPSDPGPVESQDTTMLPGDVGRGETGGDAVLDSVMAQFQMLKEDRARRRKTTANP